MIENPQYQKNPEPVATQFIKIEIKPVPPTPYPDSF